MDDEKDVSVGDDLSGASDVVVPEEEAVDMGDSDEPEM